MMALDIYEALLIVALIVTLVVVGAGAFWWLNRLEGNITRLQERQDKDEDSNKDEG